MYKEYGWRSGKTCAHGYLYPILIKIIGNNKKLQILDVGCENGYIANKLINDGFNVYGIDASEQGIKEANKINKNRFFIQDISSKELPTELKEIKFDTIISTEVIEHLYDPKGYIDFCKNILLKNGGGELIVSTPYHGYLKNLVMAISGKLDNHFTVLWDGGHIKFWSKKTLIKLLEEYGFMVICFKGSGRFPFLWKSMFIKARMEGSKKFMSLKVEREIYV